MAKDTCHSNFDHPLIDKIKKPSQLQKLWRSSLTTNCSDL
uniref:Uncharacterized protein n=1 Tax=Anguilla anguilla TaxID=7936 RepID=A0A0E9Q6D9_ANGAN